MRLSPLHEVPQTAPDPPQVIGVEDAAADTVFAALAAPTARTILALLYEQPAISTAIRDEMNTTLQTVRYHLTKLAEAGLIEPVGTDTSESGTELTRYAPAKAAIVLVAGPGPEQRRVRDHFE